jgi:hypothetical protein
MTSGGPTSQQPANKLVIFPPLISSHLIHFLATPIRRTYFSSHSLSTAAVLHACMNFFFQPRLVSYRPAPVVLPRRPCPLITLVLHCLPRPVLPCTAM